jgi:CheY-like chemotaxis protein
VENSTQTAGSGPEPQIVVADDDADILRLIERRMARRGYEVVTATNGVEALHAVETNRPAAVVLDWLMPKMTGSQACEALKANPSTAHIPIVLLTAKAADADMEEGLSIGADAYLTKPFDIHELDELVQRVIQTSNEG